MGLSRNLTKIYGRIAKAVKGNRLDDAMQALEETYSMIEQIENTRRVRVKHNDALLAAASHLRSAFEDISGKESNPAAWFDINDKHISAAITDLESAGI